MSMSAAVLNVSAAPAMPKPPALRHPPETAAVWKAGGIIETPEA
jgi:hypothetical protein